MRQMTKIRRTQRSGLSRRCAAPTGGWTTDDEATAEVITIPTDPATPPLLGDEMLHRRVLDAAFEEGLDVDLSLGSGAGYEIRLAPEGRPLKVLTIYLVWQWLFGTARLDGTVPMEQVHREMPLGLQALMPDAMALLREAGLMSAEEDGTVTLQIAGRPWADAYPLVAAGELLAKRLEGVKFPRAM